MPRMVGAMRLLRNLDLSLVPKPSSHHLRAFYERITRVRCIFLTPVASNALCEVQSTLYISNLKRRYN